MHDSIDGNVSLQMMCNCHDSCLLAYHPMSILGTTLNAVLSPAIGYDGSVLSNQDKGVRHLRHSKNIGKPMAYYSNHVATFRAQLGKSRLAGDIELNPGPGTNHCKVSLYYQNVRSLKNKLDDYKSSLCVNIESNNYHVVCF